MKAKRTTISLTEEIQKEVLKLKKKHYDKSYSELYRMLIQKGIDSVKAEKIPPAERK